MTNHLFQASTITAVLLSLASFMPSYESISVNAQENMTGGMMTGPLLTGPLGLNSTNSTSENESIIITTPFVSLPGPLISGPLGINSTNSTSVVGMTNNASR